MEYPGNQELSAEAKQRVFTAFHQVIAKLQDGRREEALIGLEFVLRLDPDFQPATHLQQQLTAGDEIDLGGLLTVLQGSASEELEQILVDAVEDFDEHRFEAAREKALRVIGELPGHSDARALLAQIDEAIKRDAQVEQYLGQAREALAGGDAQGAADFVTMAQALDPHHPDIHTALAELQHVTPAGAATPPGTGAAVTAAQGPAAPPAQPETPPEQPEAPPAQPEAPAAPAATEEVAGTPAAEEGAFAFSFDSPSAASGGGFPEFAADDTSAEGGLGGGEGSPAWEGVGDEAAAFSFGDAAVGEEATPDADIADLFADDSGSGEEGAEADPERIRQLMTQGLDLYDQGAYQEAIDVLSRVFLIDPGNAEATQLVEQARQRKDEVDRKVEHLLYEAQDAVDGGRTDDATRLLDEVLNLQPGHVEALELKERLAPAAAMPPPPPPPGAVTGATGEAAEAAPAAPAPGQTDADEAAFEEPLEIPEPLPTRPAAPASRGLPWRIIAFAGGGLLVLLIGVFFGSQLLSSGGSGSGDAAGVDQVLQQAQDLYKQGRVEEAVHLLQEFPASGLDQTRVARRLAEYQKALAPPTPTPIPDQLPRAERALDAGHWLEAYTLVLDGLRQHPHDSGLVQVRERILQHEPLVASLVKANENNDATAALSAARELVERHPGDPEFTAELERNLFNVAVAELRAYNLTGASVHLAELARRRPQDAEVQRIMEFIEKYKTRPADMQLRIFIASLSPR